MSVLPQNRSPKTSNKPQEEIRDELKIEATQRKVRFHGRVKRRYVHCIPEEEHESIWYTSGDYAKARKRESVLRKCVTFNEELCQKNRENLNAQGVFTEEQASKRHAAIEASITAVIEEQERQECAFYDANRFEQFSPNDEMIAQLYSSYAQKSLEKAHSRAARHEMHLQEIACQPEEPSSPFSPSRFMKKIPTQRSSGAKLPTKPSVFVPEGSSSLEVRCTTPAA
ncbi:MAG: hypothetical protein SGBAC_005612 [Bacillariaceae sp.]